MTLLASDTDGQFEGYASVFGQADLARDIVMPGAFQSTLQNRAPHRVRLLFQHDPATPVGAWLELKEDSYGLYCRGALNLDVQRGRELYALIKQRAIDGLSIGYKTLRAQRDLSGKGRKLFAIDLWEISLVSFPLLPDARVSAVKTSGMQHHTHVQNALLTRARTLFKSA